MGLLRENKPSNHMVSVGTKVSRWERYEATQIEDEWYIIAQNVNRDNDKKREIEVDSEEPITLLRLMTLASRLPIIQENKRLKKEDVDELIQEKDLRIEKLAQELKHYEAQKKQLEKRRNEEERKKRTHRLIEIGAAVESVLGRCIENEEIPKLIAFLNKQESNGKFFSKAMQKEPVANTEDV